MMEEQRMDLVVRELLGIMAYRESGAEAVCSWCKFYMRGHCTLHGIEIPVSPDGGCDLWVDREGDSGD